MSCALNCHRSFAAMRCRLRDWLTTQPDRESSACCFSRRPIVIRQPVRYRSEFRKLVVFPDFWCVLRPIVRTRRWAIFSTGVRMRPAGARGPIRHDAAGSHTGRESRTPRTAGNPVTARGGCAFAYGKIPVIAIGGKGTFCAKSGAYRVPGRLRQGFAADGFRALCGNTSP